MQYIFNFNKAENSGNLLGSSFKRWRRTPFRWEHFLGVKEFDSTGEEEEKSFAKKVNFAEKKRLLGIGKSIFSPGLLKPYKCLDILKMISRLDSKLRKEKTLLSC